MISSSDMHVHHNDTFSRLLLARAELKTSCGVTTKGDNGGNCSSYSSLSLHSSKPWKPFFFLPSFLLMDEATPSLKRCSCFTGSACVITEILWMLIILQIVAAEHVTWWSNKSKGWFCNMFNTLPPSMIFYNIVRFPYKSWMLYKAWLNLWKWAVAYSLGYDN